MSVTVLGTVLPKTTAEKKARGKVVALRALQKLRAKQLISNKHDMLMIGTALNRMTDKEKRFFMARNLGTWNRATWRAAETGCKLGACRTWAQRVASRTKLMQQKKATLSGAAQVIKDTQAWILTQVNKV